MDQEDLPAGLLDLQVGMPQHGATTAAAEVDHTALTVDERRWALEIKQIVESSDELTNMTDMQYAHHAIVCDGNIDQELQKIAGMQHFFREYKIDHTVEQGVLALQAMMAQQPGWLVHFEVDQVKLDSVHVVDWGAFDPQAALDCSPAGGEQGGMIDHWAVLMQGFYYMHYCCQPTLAIVRNGLMAMFECGDFGWNNFNMETQHRFQNEILLHYPHKWKHMTVYNSGTITNIAVSLVKPFMPKGMRDAFHMGCQIIEEDGSANPARRLPEFYFQPSRETAEVILLIRAHHLLTLRAYHEATFRL